MDEFARVEAGDSMTPKSRCKRPGCIDLEYKVIDLERRLGEAKRKIDCLIKLEATSNESYKSLWKLYQSKSLPVPEVNGPRQEMQ